MARSNSASPWRERRVVERPGGGTRRSPRRRRRCRWLAEVAECRPREGSEREHRWPSPRDFGGRGRGSRHRLDLDVGARLITVDLQEHVPDAQRRALAVGDDDLHLLHVGQYRKLTTGVVAEIKARVGLSDHQD